MNYDRSANFLNMQGTNTALGEHGLDTLLSFKRKPSPSLDSEAKRKQIEESKSLVMSRRLQMETDPKHKELKYELKARPLQ